MCRGGWGGGSERRGHRGDQLIFRNSATRSTIAQSANLAALCNLFHVIPAAVDFISYFFICFGLKWDRTQRNGIRARYWLHVVFRLEVRSSTPFWFRLRYRNNSRIFPRKQLHITAVRFAQNLSDIFKQAQEEKTCFCHVTSPAQPQSYHDEVIKRSLAMAVPCFGRFISRPTTALAVIQQSPLLQRLIFTI